VVNSGQRARGGRTGAGHPGKEADMSPEAKTTGAETRPEPPERLAAPPPAGDERGEDTAQAKDQRFRDWALI
jgi:hypothetical protein